MSEIGVVIATAVVVVGIVVLIVRFRLDPVVALAVGALTLGLVAGIGVDATVEAITGGFGDILAEVGLLIAFGILTGALLHRARAIERLVAGLLTACGPRGMPYATAVTVGTVLQSIFIDVLLVIAAPLARRMARRIGPVGLPRMATALALGAECGIALVVPGVGAVAVAGVLGVPLGQMLLVGVAIVVPTVLITQALMTVVWRRGWWDPTRDEQPDTSAPADTGKTGAAPAGAAPTGAAPTGAAPTGAAPPEAPAPGTAPAPSPVPTVSPPRELPLGVLFAPLLVGLLLIAAGASADAVGIRHPVLTLVSAPVVALLVALLGTLAVVGPRLGRDAVTGGVQDGFRESGQILLLTGVGGSLATTISAVGLGDILGRYFSADTAVPLLMVWVIAAVLHVAIGSVTISAITAAGVIAPAVGVLGLSPVLVAMAAGAGALFAIHVTSNTFWLLASLLGQSTRGALKTCSVAVSTASVVALLLILPLSTVV